VDEGVTNNFFWMNLRPPVQPLASGGLNLSSRANQASQTRPTHKTKTPPGQHLGKLRLVQLIAGRPERSHGLYCPLTTLAHHHVMRNREDINAVIEGLQRDHALLAAFLEATDKIDWRALHRRVVIGETSNNPINLETLQASIPQASPFVFRRANLVQISE
jgi:hypothetical protein